MKNYPYIVKTGTIKQFLAQIPVAGVPDAVTQKFIYALGFKSVNDRPIIKILEFVGFIDNAGVPTDRYRQYRNKSISARVLGEAIRGAYTELFNVYPDANGQDSSKLRNFFTTHTNLGERAVTAMTETFKALCAQAEFQEGGIPALSVPQTAVANTANNRTSATAVPVTELHKVEFALSEGRLVQVIMPRNITPEEFARLKKLVDAFGPE